MSRIEQVSVGRMWLDRFVAPYDAVAFERCARRYLNGSGSARFHAVIAGALTIVMFAAACALFVAAIRPAGLPGRSHSGIITYIRIVLLWGAPHFGCLLRRISRWRKGLSANSA